MPRVANPPTGHSRPAAKQTLATPHKASPVKLSLNDDRTEKATRLQSRQALHDIQMNQIKAAATPMRKMNGYGDNNSNKAASASPRTPRPSTVINARDRGRSKENTDPDGDFGGGSSPGGGGVLNAFSNSAVTPMKRVPILANFEEWMKMATDNKINAANSWNFALIDYFHDMSLLKEGDGVNFQKASCTLDGCVKIYTSRVDSVATETGKLLSGLADSAGGGKRGKGGREEGEGDGEGESGDEADEDGGRKKGRKKTHRSHEQTLAPSFASLQLKKLELEFTVDPLFKKASADFDEGGAKGLLLNHLSIDAEGRIVFDSSDDMADVQSYPNSTQMQQTLVDPTATAAADEAADLSLLPDSRTEEPDIDLSGLASKFFPDLALLDSQDICPSMKSFALGDPNSDPSIPFLKAPDDWRESHKTNLNSNGDRPLIDIPLGDKSGIFLDSENAAGFDDDDDMGGPLGGFDVGPDVEFGEGGEAWARDAALEPMLRVAPVDLTSREGSDGIVVGDFDPSNPDNDAYTVGLNHQRLANNGENADASDNILSYFDAALKSTKAASWAGPEHWRIRKIKAAQQSLDNPPAPRVRKEKEPFEIDFLAPLDQGLAGMLYTTAASNSAISLPKSQWKTQGRNLLPDDRHFGSKSLLQLWLKPKARLGRRRAVAGMPDRGAAAAAASVGEEGPGEMDEAFWARKREDEERQQQQRREEEEGVGKKGDYDANFFADDDDGGALPFGGGLPDDLDDDDDGPIPFTDAREMLSPPPTADAEKIHQPANGFAALSEQVTPAAAAVDPQSTSLLPGSFGAQLVTHAGRRLRPEYVNYARVAKKVDVRRLKENMWRGMSKRLVESFSPPSLLPTPPPPQQQRDHPSSNEEATTAEEMLQLPPTPAPTEPDLDNHPTITDAGVAEDDAAKDGGTAMIGSNGGGGGGGGNGKELKFTSLIRDLTGVYPEAQMRDISTSYCFICLLHLANEKGLVLESSSSGGFSGENGGGEAEMTEIRVTRDESVGVGYVGE